jgi:hypothetical protein
MFRPEIVQYYIIGLAVCAVAMGLFVSACVVIGKIIDMLMGENK